MMAYAPTLPVSKNRIVGAPGWVWHDNYDVVGKVGEANLPDWQEISQRGLRGKTRWCKPCCKNGRPSQDSCSPRSEAD